MEAAAEAPNPEPGDEFPGFLVEGASSAEESCCDLMRRVVGLVCVCVWRRWGLMVVKDDDDDDGGGCRISAIFSLLVSFFFFWFVKVVTHPLIDYLFCFSLNLVYFVF